MNGLSVYLITNTITGKTYVGRSQCPPYRWRHHRTALKCGRHPVELMQEDSYTFGYDSFRVYVFGTFPEKEAKRIEVFLMKVLRTQDSRFGYNYKDKAGTSAYAIADRWRTPPNAWQKIFRNKYLQGIGV